VIEAEAGTASASTIAVAVTDETARRAQTLAGQLEAGHDVALVEAAALDVEVTPPYLTTSYAFYRTLRGRDFGVVVFPDRGGHAYCSVRARQGGLEFARTQIVIDCLEPTLRAADRNGELFLSRRALGTSVAERLSLELADAYLCEDAELLGWYRRQGWALPVDEFRGAAPAPPPRGARVSEDPPLVTVAIAYHERTEYLPLCLEGFARQSHPALEVVVVDDGSRSTAARAQLAELEARSWPWPLRILRERHGGLGAARNAGWRAAAGELVLFFDDDDIPFDGLVESLWRARTVSGADFAVAGARFFRGERGPTAHAGDVVRISLGEPRELGVISNQYGGAVGLWPTELLEHLGGFESMPFEDWDLLARATLAGATAAAPPDPLFWYRQTTGGMYSADPVARRDAGLAVISTRFADRLPEELRLLPRLAAGAYSELERRKHASTPRRRAALDRGRLLLRRARQVRDDQGALAVVRHAARFLRRRS
jgi:hypothetical protein